MISKWWRRKWDWKQPPVNVRVIEGGQRSFEVDFYESIVRRQSDYWEALAVLGNHYTVEERYREGLAVDRRLAELRPDDPIVFYNLACSYTLVGWIPAALRAMARCLELGYRDFKHLMHDKDLDALRKDQRFEDLLSPYVKT
jgi:hypothetical protein